MKWDTMTPSHMAAQTPLPSRRTAIRIGIILIVVSFVISFGGVPVVAATYGVKYGGYFYLLSWVPFLVGILIGGRAAVEESKRLRRNFFQKIKGK